jgi:hyperosmotically inducible protein
MAGKLQTIITTILFTIAFTVKAADFKSLEQDLSDSIVTTKITAQYTESKLLNPFKISVSTENGIVTLTGHVDNKKAYIKALQIAKQTKGVKDVDSDELIIKKVNTQLTDALITAKVEASVLKAKVFDDESIPLIGINASTENGTVALSGKLKSEHAISSIIKRASAVHGVKKIISHLELTKG